MAINIHDAKTQFSKLVERAIAGESVIIARAGKPVAKLTRLDAPATARRLGFLEGHSQVPDDFNEWARDEVVELFEEGE